LPSSNSSSKNNNNTITNSDEASATLTYTAIPEQGTSHVTHDVHVVVVVSDPESHDVATGNGFGPDNVGGGIGHQTAAQSAEPAVTTSWTSLVRRETVVGFCTTVYEP
jgi:hypothetical protein